MNTLSTRLILLLALLVGVSFSSTAQTPSHAFMTQARLDAPPSTAPARAPVEARWQTTINQLLEADAGTSTRYDAANTRAAALLDALRLNRGPIRTMYVANEMHARDAENIVQTFDLLEQMRGALVDYAVHGTVPQGRREASTFAEARFADGSTAVFRITWKKDRLIGLAHIEPPTAPRGRELPSAAWQPTINWLTDADERTAMNVQAHNARTSLLLDALHQGDYQPLAQAWHETRRQAGKKDIKQMMHAFEVAYGPVVGCAVLGTVPGPNDTAYTFAEMRFANGSTVPFRLVWLDDALMGFTKTLPLLTMTAQHAMPAD